jgi:H+-transporting ATPase
MGAIPVALPAVLTIVQAVGAMELAKEGVLVTRLDSIEDAASIDIAFLQYAEKLSLITEKVHSYSIIPTSAQYLLFLREGFRLFCIVRLWL